MSAIERRSRSTYPIPDLYEITNNLVSTDYWAGYETCPHGRTNPEAVACDSQVYPRQHF